MTTRKRETRVKRVVVAAIALLMPLSAVTACSSSQTDASSTAAAAPADITVYSGRTENLISPIVDQFEQATGIEVDVRYGDSADLALLIEQEGDRSPADVFISQSPGAMGYLADKGLLGEVDAQTLKLVDEDFRNEGGQWAGFSGRVRSLVYNTDQVDPNTLPKSVFDLTAPQYAGQVAVAPTNSSFQDFVTTMRLQEGDAVAAEWLKGMADNGSPTYADNTSIVQAVARGEVPMGLVNHYYNARALAEDPTSPTDNYYFESGDVGALLITTAVGILKSTDDEKDAQALATFLLGEEAQEFFSNETFEYPLARGAKAAEALPALEEINTTTFDLDSLGGGLETTLQMIEASGLTTS
jgi:iron(III) transport system substrate-binding protein